MKKLILFLFVAMLLISVASAELEITPTSERLTLSAGSTTPHELIINNRGNDKVTVNAGIDIQGTRVIAQDWVTFGNTDWRTFEGLVIDTRSTFDGDTAWVLYWIEIPPETPLGDYEILIRVEDANSQEKHYLRLDITVTASKVSKFVDFWDSNFIDSSLPCKLNPEECPENITFQTKWLFYIMIAMLLTIATIKGYYKAKDMKRKHK